MKSDNNNSGTKTLQ